MKIVIAIGFAFLSLGSAFAISGEELAKKQARSVHLWYEPTVPNAQSVCGTVRVTETQTNSYYCILGWNGGYCGIQDKGAGGNILIFSVWDPIDHEAVKGLSEAERVELSAKVLYARKGVDVARFGGEGTGARTMTKIGWKVGKPVTVRIDSAPDGTNRTAFTCFLKNPKDDGWIKIASISTLLREGKASGINGVHSFLEDFWRNYHSATLVRRAEYSDIATRSAGSKEWVKATSAVFSADGTPSNAIDAGRVPVDAESSPRQKDPVFFLQTGGATTNAHAKLWGKL